MRIRPLRQDLEKNLAKFGLKKKFQKQKQLFEANPRHPSLHTKKLNPLSLRLYSFRLDRKWRAIFIIVGNEAEIIDVNAHYQ